MMIKRAVLFLLSIFFSLHAEMAWHWEAQEPFSISIKAGGKEVPLGESVDMLAEFRYPSSYELDLDTLIEQLAWSANPLFPNWNMVKKEIFPLPKEEGMIGKRLEIKMIPLVAGNQELSFLSFPFNPKNEKEHPPLQVAAPVFSFHVQGPAPSETPPPLAPPIPLTPQFPLGLTVANQRLLVDNPERIQKSNEYMKAFLESHSYPWLSLIALLCLGSIGWTAYLMRPRLFHTRHKPVKKLSPREQIGKFLSLERKCWVDERPIENYYASVSALLLKALEERLGLMTDKLTTSQLARALEKRTDFSNQQIHYVVSLFNQIDEIKFSGKKPTRTEAEEIAKNTQAFIAQLFL